jgi:hypothetical protein
VICCWGLDVAKQPEVCGGDWMKGRPRCRLRGQQTDLGPPCAPRVPPAVRPKRPGGLILPSCCVWCIVHKVVCISTVARGAPWARHPLAGQERAPNCASTCTGRLRGCIARGRLRVSGGATYRCVHRGGHRGCVPALRLRRFWLTAQPCRQGWRQWRWGHGVGIIFAPDFCDVLCTKEFSLPWKKIPPQRRWPARGG